MDQNVFNRGSGGSVRKSKGITYESGAFSLCQSASSIRETVRSYLHLQLTYSVIALPITFSDLAQGRPNADADNFPIDR